jgi:hypothetical protein
MAAQEVEQLTPGLRVLLLGEEMRTAWHNEGLDLLAVAFQRLGHGLRLVDRHILELDMRVASKKWPPGKTRYCAALVS